MIFIIPAIPVRFPKASPCCEQMLRAGFSKETGEDLCYRRVLEGSSCKFSSPGISTKDYMFDPAAC